MKEKNTCENKKVEATEKPVKSRCFNAKLKKPVEGREICKNAIKEE